MNTNGHNHYDRGAKGGGFDFSAVSKSNELFDFKRFYSIIKRYIWVIVVCAILGTGIAYYFAYDYLLPIYSSQSTILIQGAPDNFPGTSSDIGKIVSSSYNLSTNGTVESEIQFIKSRELSNEVAHQVKAAKYLADGQIYPLLWADYPNDSTLVSENVVAGRIRRALSVKPIDQGSNILSVTFESYSPYEAARVVNFSVNAYKEITASKKRSSAQSALKFLDGEKNRIKDKLNQSENQLSGFKNSQNLVSIDSQTDNLVNTVSSLQTKKEDVSIQLESVKAGIENHQKQLEAIKPGLGEKYSEAAGPTITNYQQQLAKLRTERLILVSNNPQLKTNPDSEPRMRKLDKEINDLEQEIKQLTDNLMSGSQSYLGLLAGSDGNVTKEISSIQANLTQLRIQKSQLQAQLQAINDRLGKNQNFLDKVPQNQMQLERLKRQSNIFEQSYLNVNQQASELSLWEQTRTGAGTVIDYAEVHKSPIKPQKMEWLIVGAFLGLLIPVGFIMLKEGLNNTINSIDDLKKNKYPLLAVIYNHSLLDESKINKFPETESRKNTKISKDLVLYHYGLSPIAESYRSLVSKILYSQPDNPPKTLLITSAGPAEGKTTLTSNMAVALTEMGKKVLIVDCDMRKSGLPKFFGVSKEPGIMEILFKDYGPEAAVKNISIPGLDLLTGGKKQPARPNSILSSQAFKKLIERFKLTYDFILLDSAPFGIIGDVAPLLYNTDGVIVNSRFLSTKYFELQHTIDELENNSAKILGLVLNGYNPQKSVDDSEVKGLYNNMYKSYYDYQETKTTPKTNKRKHHGRIS